MENKPIQINDSLIAIQVPKETTKKQFTNNSKTIEMEKAPNIFLGIAITLLLYSLCKVEGIEIAIITALGIIITNQFKTK